MRRQRGGKRKERRKDEENKVGVDTGEREFIEETGVRGEKVTERDRRRKLHRRREKRPLLPFSSLTFFARQPVTEVVWSSGVSRLRSLIFERVRPTVFAFAVPVSEREDFRR